MIRGHQPHVAVAVAIANDVACASYSLQFYEVRT